MTSPDWNPSKRDYRAQMDRLLAACGERIPLVVIFDIRGGVATFLVDGKAELVTVPWPEGVL